MAAEFRKVYATQGFDREENPRWQMVPTTGSRYVILRDGVGLTVAPETDGIVAVTEVKRADLPPGAFNETFHATDRFFKIESKKYGIIHVEAKNGAGANVVRLEIDTKNVKKFKVGFNFVKDSTGRRTRRQPASARQWVREMNRNIFSQANVELEMTRSDWVRVPQSLGDVVRFSSHLPAVAAAQHEWDVVTGTGDPTADFNVFFVWEYEQDDTPYTDNTGAGTLNGNTIFEDYLQGSMVRNLAHELGHAMGLPDHYTAAHKHDLMYGYEDGGWNIPKAHANSINP